MNVCTCYHLPDDIDDCEVKIGTKILRRLLILFQDSAECKNGILDHGIHGFPFPETKIPQNPHGEAAVVVPKASICGCDAWKMNAKACKACNKGVRSMSIRFNCDGGKLHETELDFDSIVDSFVLVHAESHRCTNLWKAAPKFAAGLYLPNSEIVNEKVGKSCLVILIFVKRIWIS